MNTGRTHFKKGYAPWNKGLKTGSRPQWVKDKISKSHKLTCQLKKHIPWNKETKGIVKPTAGSFKPREANPMWKGGVRTLYTIGWTNKLKRLIKERDKYQCQYCGNTCYLDVHHIDKKKDNHSLDNLITLCSSCHRKQHTTA